MKKYISSILSVIITTAMIVPVSAANGDIAGKIYSTDIMAYINGVPIESYNIGGKTAFVIEDLQDNETWDYNYGFNWSYDDESRTLTVNSQFYDNYFTKKEISRGKVGKITGNIYATDIKVIFNSKEVQSYNIGGRTAVCIEDLGTVDDTSPNKEFGYSQYICNFNWDEENRSVSLDTYQSNYFMLIDNYPIKKLQFTLNDNKLSCSFDQMNRYSLCLQNDFTDEFAKDTYKLKKVYMDDTVVGSMFVDDNTIINMHLDKFSIYEKVKDLATVLTYDEAKKFITDNYEISDTYEDENASVYIGIKDEKKCVLYALKKDGFLLEAEYGIDQTVKFKEVDGTSCVFVEPFGGPHGPTSMFYELETAYYNFNGSYEDYKCDQFSEYSTKGLKFGNLPLTVDDEKFDVDALIYYNLNTPMVNVDKMAQILGIDYKFSNGKFIFDTKGIKHSININQDNMTGNYGNTQYPVYNMIINEVVLNGEKAEFTFLGGGTLLTNGKTYEKSVNPYFYNNQAYVPYHFFENLYSISDNILY